MTNYGSTLVGSDIARNDLMVSVVYPDSSSDSVSYLYNRQSQVKQLTDQRAVVHAYDFDLLGRMTHDRVTSFLVGSSSSGSSSGAQPAVDSAVQRIERSYDERGMLASVANYDSPTVGGGNLVTQVQFTYNSFAQLITETDYYALLLYSVTTQYAYADGSANTIRRTSMTYPSGRTLNYSYGPSGGMDDALSRVASLIDDDGVTHLADYTRLGVGTFVQLACPQPQATWSLINGTGSDPYTGLDQFNRVVDNRWYNTSSSSDLDRIQHGYDRAGNRLWRKNTVAEAAGANLDELYAHDGLDRLTQLQRGQLNSSNNGIVSGTLTFSEAWGLDATGNWSGSPLGGGFPYTYNQVNEITSGTVWGSVSYDAAGNTTQFPLNPGNSLSPNYDAWNRLASADGSAFIYDGLGRLATYNSHHSYFYSDSWQLIEQREGQYQGPERQFVWGLRYVDDIVLRDSNDYHPTRLYALQDANWNVSALVDATGAVRERYAYDAYGQVTFMFADFSLTAGGTGYYSQFDWETLFAGYRFWGGYTFYLVRNRWYVPLLGRWLTRDARGGLNLYLYCESSPIECVDGSGLAPRKPKRPKPTPQPPQPQNPMPQPLTGKCWVKIWCGKVTKDGAAVPCLGTPFLPCHCFIGLTDVNWNQKEYHGYADTSVTPPLLAVGPTLPNGIGVGLPRDYEDLGVTDCESVQRCLDDRMKKWNDSRQKYCICKSPDSNTVAYDLAGCAPKGVPITAPTLLTGCNSTPPAPGYAPYRIPASNPPNDGNCESCTKK